MRPQVLGVSLLERVRVRFFKKIQDWILKSERIRKRILCFFITQINPRSFRSWCIKGTEESISRVDSSVPLMHHDPRDLGLICLIKKHKILFRILSDLRIQSWIFFEETHPLRLRSFGVIGSGSVIQDLSGSCASKGPVNPWPEWIHRFLWCTMIQKDLGSLPKGTQPKFLVTFSAAFFPPEIIIQHAESYKTAKKWNSRSPSRTGVKSFWTKAGIKIWVM